jgi:hypothetical protein
LTAVEPQPTAVNDGDLILGIEIADASLDHRLEGLGLEQTVIYPPDPSDFQCIIDVDDNAANKKPEISVELASTAPCTRQEDQGEEIPVNNEARDTQMAELLAPSHVYDGV